MELKVICPTCKGKSIEIVCDGSGLGTIEKLCKACNGKGYTNPPQEILDDLECAEIERELIDNKSIRLTINQGAKCTKLEVRQWNGSCFAVEYTAFEKTKLEALRKAKEWLDRRK